MISFFWILYFLLSFLMAFLVRKLFVNKLIKIFSFGFTISFFISFWFSYPGSNDLSPIFSIILMDIFEAEKVNFSRILRPFLTFFVIIVMCDFLFSIKRSKIKN